MSSVNKNPVAIPVGWTYLIHGSSEDKWQEQDFKHNFVVNKELCCVSRREALQSIKQDFYTAKTYGGGKDKKPFQIRVLFLDRLRCYRTPENAVIKQKLSSDQEKEVEKYYAYQCGRHPAVPRKTKMIFLAESSYDEVTGQDGAKILWYIPEQYMDFYKYCIENQQEIQREVDKIKLMKMVVAQKLHQ